MTSGLRERKAAATRLSLARALEARLGEKSLAEVTADELADDAGVSRVTFFNYFPTKEHALDYVVASWLFRVQADSASRGLSGLRAIEFVFDSFAESIQESPPRSLQMVAFFAARPQGWLPTRLGPAERLLIAPEASEVEQRTLGDWLMFLIAEARRDGEIDSASTDYELGHMLGALLLGGMLVGRSAKNQQWRRLYRHHLRHVLRPGPPERKRRAR